ncbi:ADC synthase [Macrophomina phaseolina]|uniref:aminodeoxychorismate synthase n=1 Tax=Macrophomina phaseolina TaxID=35725 RepID=A0ABQ8GL21_9PEZI|nr:ADC synthase [Macrophomina phaseolina]
MDQDGICAAPRILFIDAYDSFANNIVALLELELRARVTTIYIDDPNFLHRPSLDFYLFLQSFDAVVAGPGPGSVINPRDTGLISILWSLPDHHLLPVLGICLGFQSLAYAFGAEIQRLPEPRHGIVTNVLHQRTSLFEHLSEVHATQYHSLHVDVGFPSSVRRAHPLSTALWSPSTKCPDLIPLAWDCDSSENGPVLMSLKHRIKPFWGVQYHPESICTDLEGARIIQNWWCQAKSWLSSHSPSQLRQGSLGKLNESGSRPAVGCNSRRGNLNHNTSAWDHLSCRLLQCSLINRPGIHVAYECLNPALTDVRRICELLTTPGQESVVLESGMNKHGRPIRAETGNKSIIGCLEQERNLRLEYFVDGQVLELRVGRDLVHRQEGADVWQYIKHLLSVTRVAKGPADSPFWGGLVGFVSYEAGLETINANPNQTPGQASATVSFRKPDLSFAFVTRSVVVDHISHKVYVQSIRDGDCDWVRSTTRRIHGLATPPPRSQAADVSSALAGSAVAIPTQTSYENKVRSCQESIRAGDSYELCLTSQTTISLPRSSSANFPWNLYTRLRHLNPAPFGAYIRLGPPGAGVNILSSSPERFLSWTREGLCQYRPIKGTVRKEAGVTRDDAERILNSSKERAENLMIVDLVRHDLHGVVGAGNVRVSKLMGVEEYETVWQLVSVIEGDLTGSTQQKPTHRNEPRSHKQSVLGIDILHASLPPGSMTGAPKKRSCELLNSIEEGQPRGVYSGVLGYLDVGGGGDFAVVIRTAWRWDTELEENEPGNEIWRVGAGGAVTAQSTPEGEYEEMLVKLESALRVFDGNVKIDE